MGHLHLQKAAQESRAELEAALAGADMVFVTVSCQASAAMLLGTVGNKLSLCCT